MSCKKNVCLLVMFFLFTGLVFSQTKEVDRIEKNRNEVLKVLKRDYPNLKLQHFKELSENEMKLHKERLFAQYKEKGLWVDGASPPYYYYNRRFHPSKVEVLRNLGLQLPPPLSPDYPPFREHVIFAETIIIGQVRKFVYHPDKSKTFHTSAIVVVDEFLRDDFGLKENYNEVVVKLQSGPVEGGAWIRSSLEPMIRIGEKCLFYLSRVDYVRTLVFNGENMVNSELKPNMFALLPPGKYPIFNSDVIWNPHILDLNEVKSGIREVVRILDVEHFYDN